MFHLKVRYGVLLAVLGLAVPVWAQETIESVEKKLVEAAGKVKAISFKMVSTSDMKFGETATKSDMVSTCDCMQAGAKFKSRTDTKTSSVTKGGGQDMKMETTGLVVCDGEHTYTLSEMMGQKSASKSRIDPMQNQLDVKTGFAMLKQNYTLKVLPDEKVDGKDCFVIEATPKDPAMFFAKQVSYYSKEHGLALKGVMTDKDGKTVGTMTVSDVKLDPTFPPEHFTFKAPPGVTVQDMTKMGEAPKEEKPEKPEKE